MRFLASIGCLMLLSLAGAHAAEPITSTIPPVTEETILFNTIINPGSPLIPNTTTNNATQTVPTPTPTAPSSGTASAIPETPTAYVTDTIGLLTPSQQADINAKLQQTEDDTSVQIAILIINTVGFREIGDVALETFNQWGVGQSDTNNGILLLIAKDDRKAYISTGYGAEGMLPDVVAYRLLRDILSTSFAKAQFYEGIDEITNVFQEIAAGEYDIEAAQQPDVPLMDVFVLLFFASFWIGPFLGLTKTWWEGGILGAIAGGGLWVWAGWWWMVPMLILFGLGLDYFYSNQPPPSSGLRRGSRNRWGGGFGGGRGGGGFGGFGGGMSGGGGAGGSW